MSSYFFTDNFEYDAKGAAKHFTPEAVKLLTALAEKFAAVSELTEIKAEEIVRTYAEELQVKPAVLIHPTRLAVTGSDSRTVTVWIAGGNRQGQGLRED